METKNRFNFKKDDIFGGILSPELTDISRITVDTVMCSRTVAMDIGGDMNLPEHMPELKKLVKVEVIPTAPSKFVSDSGAQISGGVEYRAIYQDGEGELYLATVPGEYSFSLPFNEGISRGDFDRISVSARVYPESAVSRVAGSGKINIRCRLVSKILVLGERNIDMDAIPEEEHLQRLVKKTDYCRELFATREDVELSCTVSIPEADVRYISTECDLYIEDSVSGEGYADCRGYALVKHLMSRKGKPYTVSERIPFSETVEIDHLPKGAEVCVRGSLCGITVEMPENTDESGRGPEIILRVCLEAFGFERCETNYVKDVYSTAFELSSENETCVLPYLISCHSGNMTFNGREELSKLGISDDRITTVDVVGSATAESVDREGDKWVVNGKCRFAVMYETEDDGEVKCAETELPFKYEFNGAEGETARFDCNVFAVDCGCRCEGERINLDCELYIVTTIIGEHRCERVCSVSVTGDRGETRRGFTVCYPDKSDSLWSVAKRYRANVLTTALENGIEAGGDADCVGLPEGKKYMIV